jgi:hypothetical protein
MLKRLAVSVLLVGMIAAGALAEFVSASPAGAGNASTGKGDAVASVAPPDSTSDAVASVAPPDSTSDAVAGVAPPDSTSDAVARVAPRDSLTARAVSAARAFEASLSSVQRAAVQYSFNSEKKSGWSIEPTNLVPRNGAAVRDLSARQQARLWALLRTITSAQGYADEVGVRKADTYIRREYHGGTSLASKFDYGEGRYYVAFFGTPSRSRKWMVQFTGHHYTLNMTFSGASVSNTPYFIGVNPPSAFKLNGRTYDPMADQVAAMFGAVRSLNASQRARARLTQRFTNVMGCGGWNCLGAGMYGQFPPPRQGITVSMLDRAQEKLVTRAIWSYVGVMPRAQANRLMATYEQQYSQTELAWSGSTNPTTPGAYVRIHGPRVWIELVLQPAFILRAHYHSIERDFKGDYGAGT